MPSIAIFAIEIAHQLVIDFQTFILSWPLIHQLSPLNPFSVSFLGVFIFKNSIICAASDSENNEH